MPSPDPVTREVAGRPDLYVGQTCTLDPGQYPRDDGRRFRIVTIRETRVFVGGFAVGVQPLEGAPYGKPRELAANHLHTDGNVRQLPSDWRALDIGGRARNRNGLPR